MRKLLAVAVLALLALLALLFVLAYLLLKPTAVDPVAWQAPAAPGLVGAHAANARLKDVQRLAAGIGIGPEGIGIDADGSIVTGFEDGRVIRLSADAGHYEVLANTGGRPLGVGFAADGAPLVADARKGLLRIADGHAVPLVTEAGGRALGFTDDVDVAGTQMLFSDASTKFGYHQYMLDVLEHRPHGRLLIHDGGTGATTELARDLYFANGVAWGPDDAYVLVSETSAYRIKRIWLKGAKAGTADLFADNLPGFPDNLSFNGRDRVWVALAGPRDAGLDALAEWPQLRRMLARLPAAIQQRLAFSPIKHGHVLGFDLQGRVIADLQHHAADAYAPITSVEERGPWLYFGSLNETSIARLPLNRAVADADPPSEGWQQAPTAPLAANH